MHHLGGELLLLDDDLEVPPLIRFLWHSVGGEEDFIDTHHSAVFCYSGSDLLLSLHESLLLLLEGPLWVRLLLHQLLLLDSQPFKVVPDVRARDFSGVGQGTDGHCSLLESLPSLDDQRVGVSGEVEGGLLLQLLLHVVNLPLVSDQINLLLLLTTKCDHDCLLYDGLYKTSRLVGGGCDGRGGAEGDLVQVGLGRVKAQHQDLLLELVNVVWVHECVSGASDKDEKNNKFSIKKSGLKATNQLSAAKLF